MKGWKTYTGAGIVALGAILRYFDMVAVADAVMALGAALGLIGIGHKIEKSG